ncbi:MAG: hypothetical protein FJZ01_13995 [Candidatus Sericytochromatia bacterium]|nr:hypothetical protein [Candidatus Tanganyikabacteria bacterium]
MKPVFEVVIDHADPAHHARMEQLRSDLLAFARRCRCSQLQREETQIRPGVMRLRFHPAGPRLQPALGADQLQLSG